MWVKADNKWRLHYSPKYMEVMLKDSIGRKSLQRPEISTGTHEHSLCVEGEMAQGENIHRVMNGNEWPDKQVKGPEGRFWELEAKSSRVETSG